MYRMFDIEQRKAERTACQVFLTRPAGYHEHMADPLRPATVDDIHEIARALPGATLGGARGRAKPTVYEVSRRSFLFFRNPRPDAVDPETGERYADVIVFWVESELEKEAILADSSLPFFTTPHFDGHNSVLLRGSRVGELSRDELAGFVEGAWLSRAGPRAAAKWLKEQG
jgi:hypothetical protein